MYITFIWINFYKAAPHCITHAFLLFLKSKMQLIPKLYFKNVNIMIRTVQKYDILHVQVEINMTFKEMKFLKCLQQYSQICAERWCTHPLREMNWIFSEGAFIQQQSTLYLNFNWRRGGG